MERQLTRRLLQSTPNRTWEYASAAIAQEEAGVLVVEIYIRHLQNTVTQYIDTQQLLYLCEKLERAPKTQIWMRWREQLVIDLAGAQEAAVAAKEGDEG